MEPETSKGENEHLLLPQEVIEHYIEHALRVKDYSNPGYNFRRAEDIMSYIQEGLADLALGWSDNPQLDLRKIDFGAAVIGKVFDIPRNRPCHAYTHFWVYDNGQIVGNQVDEFLTRIGFFNSKENKNGA